MKIQEQLKHMMDFTKIHQKYSGGDIYQREVKCLQKQFSCCLLPLRENDLIAGRLFDLPIGFSPQSNGSVGYYCNVNRLTEMMKESCLTDEESRQFIYLIDYWKDKTTYAKIYKRYPDEIINGLSHGDFTTEKGVGYPLYRLSGAQMDPFKLLEFGILGLIKYIRSRKGYPSEFYLGLIDSLSLLRSVCLDYSISILNKAETCTDKKRRMDLLAIGNALKNITCSKPATFLEAIQLSYLFFTLSGAINYGRLDEYLGTFYVNDLKSGKLTEKFALEILMNMWSLINERKIIWDGRIILGGKDRRNPEDADELAILAMEASNRVKDVLPQLTLRMYDGMNHRLTKKAYECISEGTTYPILYNDSVNIPSVAKAFGVDFEMAKYYVPFGCGEYVLYNKSFGTPSGTLNLLQALNESIYDSDDSDLLKSSTFEIFYTKFLDKVEEKVKLLALQEKIEYDVCGEEAGYLFFSILFDDCIERGKAIFDGGIKHLGGTLECYGNTNTADSLTAIKTLVYDKKLISPEYLVGCLKDNFENNEAIRKLLLNAPKFGNDNQIADEIACILHTDVCLMIREQAKSFGLDSYLAVIINNSMNTTFGLTTGASADGRRAHTYMANANNPSGGMDKNGITAMLNSLVKLDTDIHAGSVQNLRFSKEMFGELLPKTEGLLEAYFLNGGTQIMITVLNKGDLEQAIKEPEKYHDLIVRVGGFSARFVELSPSIQKELLSRTIY